MGRVIEDLPAIIGISRRTLFECRSADSAVSCKSWLKLEAAERAAGVGNVTKRDGDPATSVAENSGKVKDSGKGGGIIVLSKADPKREDPQRDETLRLARERDQKLLAGADKVTVDTLLDLEGKMDRMVLCDERSRKTYVQLCHDRIDEFAEWVEDYRQDALDNGEKEVTE